MPLETIEVVYRNWRGEVGTRRIVPTRVWYGQTEHHPKDQWLLDCVDVDKGAERTFALANCDFDSAHL